MTLEKEGDDWNLAGMGDCRLWPVLTRDAAWVELSTPAGGLDTTATELQVGVAERECASGRDPCPHLNDPTVVETADTVTVYWTSGPARRLDRAARPRRLTYGG